MPRGVKSKPQLLADRFLTVSKVVLLSGILVTIFFLSAILGMRLVVRGSSMNTPALVGMSLPDAEELFKKLKLNLVVRGRRYDDAIPPGGVISQSPGPGVGIKADRDVAVMVSLGRRTNSVPDLRGNSVRAARLVAVQNNYELGSVGEITAEGADDRIVAQFPAPEAQENTSDRIDILVQRPLVRAYIMPEVVGWTMSRVLSFLKQHGFEVSIFYRRHEGVERGTVVRQFPEAGYMLKVGEKVNLEVAR